MKKAILLSFMFMGFILVARSQDSSVKIEASKPDTMAKFKWDKTTHDFGKIPQGTPVTVEFNFTNVGKSPLVISDVKGSCGCTVPSYSKEPVAPGKTGVIKATYNAAAMGTFNKSVRVTANVEGGSETLYIKGEVVKQES